MIRYVFKDKPITLKGASKANAQKIGEALAKIEQASRGECNSKTVLDAARDKSNYLHRFFEWRDDIAAEKFRQEQARELMSCINIVDHSSGKERKLPAFVSLIDRGGRSYHTVGEVLNSDHLQAIALRQTEAEMEAMEKRLMQFADIANAIRHARELIRQRRERYEESRPQV